MNGNVDNANWIHRNLVLPSAGGAPENLSLGRVQLQPVGLHPDWDVVGTPGKAVSKGRNIKRSTGAVI